MKICVYAICKNERKFLDMWIDAVSEADCVCVLDTGSTDGTWKELQRRQDGNTYLCQRTGESDGGTVVLQYMPHELVGHYFVEVI